MPEYDKSSKWLIQHHGDSILRLAGVNDIASWTPLQAELVQSRRLPDGVLEVRISGEAEPDVFILGLRYNDLTLREKLRALLGGRQAMIESPILQEFEAEFTRKATIETRQKDIVRVLVTRFGDAAKAVEAELKAVAEDQLEGLIERAAKCRSLASFRKQVSS